MSKDKEQTGTTVKGFRLPDTLILEFSEFIHQRGLKPGIAAGAALRLFMDAGRDAQDRAIRKFHGDTAH